MYIQQLLFSVHTSLKIYLPVVIPGGNRGFSSHSQIFLFKIPSLCHCPSTAAQQGASVTVTLEDSHLVLLSQVDEVFTLQLCWEMTSFRAVWTGETVYESIGAVETKGFSSL